MVLAVLAFLMPKIIFREVIFMTTINAIGRITKDFELKKSEKSDCIYANFSLAVNEGFGDNQKAMYFECTVFGADAERLIKAKAKKGSLIQVTGKFGVSYYHNEATGKSGYNLKITVLGWSYIPGSNGKKDANDGNGNSENSATNDAQIPNHDPGPYPPPEHDYDETTNLDEEGAF